ncbi:cytochrome c-type biogenesis protein [Variovorax sp. YR752]|uniref:cytochrome c-type biogenesis protein n=1 Tax=Variovorax sp. YR752 TaxID=1884383 RepID=UPI003137FEFB
MSSRFTMRGMTGWLLALCLALPLVAAAKDAAPASDDPVLEAKVMRISAELRCLVCQNQTIADSHADLAQDLRGQVREMLKKGQSEAQIIDYMTQRYGDFVLYRPPVKSTTALLWYGPALLMIGGLVVLVVVLRRRSKLPDDQFEPDEGEDAGTEPAQPLKG